MVDKNKPADLENKRNILMLTNNRADVQPLIVLIPQWSKASVDLMSRERQEQIYSEFAHELGLAWEKLLREY